MDTPNLPIELDPQWLALLRSSFAEIARRRVPEDMVEDLVHDALGVVLSKGPTEALADGHSHPSLRWSFNVLRNVIGNYYQKRRQHDPVEEGQYADERPDALAAMTRDERARSVRSAVDELRTSRPDCARWLWSMAQGSKAGTLADDARIEHAAFYRKIYRCRKMLAEILQRRGVDQ